MLIADAAGYRFCSLPSSLKLLRVFISALLRAQDMIPRAELPQMRNASEAGRRPFSCKIYGKRR